MTRRLAALLAVLLCASGCRVPRGAGFDEVQRLVGERAPERLHWNRGMPEDDAVAAAVRRLLADELSVASATQIALFNNPRLQATYERLGVSQADLVQAGLLRNPSLTLGLGFPFSPTQAVSYELNLVQEFIDLFMIPLRKRFARAEFRRVKLEVGDAVLDLAADVRVAFYNVAATQQVVAMRRAIVEAAEASAELAQRQQRAGNASELDLANEQGQYAQTKLDLARSEAQLALDRERLNRLLGVWGRGVTWRAGALPELPPASTEPPLEHVESFAVAHRLDLAAAEEERKIVAAALAITKSTRFFAAVEVGLHAEGYPDRQQALGPHLRLELPIFDQRQAAVARLESQRRMAERHVEAVAIDVRAEVRAARARVVAARGVVEFFKNTMLPLRERIVRASQLHYNAMLLGTFQLLLAKQGESNTYREYIEAVRDYWIARSDLERAAGGRLPEARR